MPGVCGNRCEKRSRSSLHDGRRRRLSLTVRVRVFQTYAMSYVAIYGRSLSESAQATHDLLRTTGVDVIVNDSMANGVLNIGVIVGTLFSW